MSKMFPRLSEPGVIGNVTLKNRMIKAPQHTGLSNLDGSVNERMIRYYRDVATGGVGMIIVEYAFVDNDASRAAPCQLGISNMDYIPGLSLLSQTIQANGCKAAIQISHAGRQKFTLSRPIKAPSTVPWEEIHLQGCPPPEELTFEEIRQIVKSFGIAAKRAQTADFDMVEVHACHGYLISNFLSPRTNKRTDWYGGSQENRMRFMLEVIEEIKSQVGPNYPVLVRVSGTDYEPDGYSIEETLDLCHRMEKMGIAAIHVSGGNHHQTIHEVSPMGMSLAHNVWAAEAIKKQVSIPVIASGSITSPKLAESILLEGKSDFISLGRPLWADPEFPMKTMEDRPEEIRPCIRCNDGCLARGDQMAKVISCSVNASVCREEEFKIVKVENPKKVAIIGGGPAGMEAARVCALKGHKVTLYERRKLGGALLEASVPDFKAPDLKPLIDYYETQMKKLNIKLVDKEASADVIQNGKFDAVIIAIGAKAMVPENVVGIDRNIVLSALDVLAGKANPGQKVAVIGGGMVGTEVGLFLAEQGREIAFVELTDTFMNGITTDERQVYEERFKNLKVMIFTGRRLEAVDEKDITIVDRFGAKTRIPVDSVILAVGFTSNRGLAENLKKQSGLNVIEAGDCVKPRKIFDAIHDGHLAAKLLN